MANVALRDVRKTYPGGVDAIKGVSEETTTGVHRLYVMERDGKLCFTEFKGRNKTPKSHELPILPPLRAGMSVEVEVNTGKARGLPHFFATLFSGSGREG